ncbi:hypothetical protein V6N13_002252 [Hibiscus sabdariffa]
MQHAGARDEKGNPIIKDFYGSPLTASGKPYDDMLVAKFESVYTGSGDQGSSMFAFNMEQGLPIMPEWLFFNRVNARARKGVEIGPTRLLLSLSGGHVVGNFSPHEAFAIGGTNSVRGYEEGAVGSGRYDGQVVALNGSDSAKISFLTPTSENMLTTRVQICKFFLQQRCRFGASCRLSHGVDVPLSSLKKYATTMWEPSMVGSSIWAVSDGRVGIWREAELESWNDELRTGKVVFRDDGSSAELGIEALTLSKYAQMSDDEESELSSEESEPSDYDEEDSPRGIGFLESTAGQRGIQTETTIFAKWENHTRGVASKMMASMGYREGMGLGASGQGMLDPISVKVLPPKLSLDHALESHENDEGKEKKGKKRSRGGKRKREKKFAEAARAAKEKEESRADVFSLINNQLAMHNEAVNGGSTRKQQKKGSGEEKKVDRKALVAYDDEVKDLKLRVVKLEEMMSRNRNEKAVYDAAMRKLNETCKALAEAEAVHASASNAVASKEKEKKWLKF